MRIIENDNPQDAKGQKPGRASDTRASPQSHSAFSHSFQTLFRLKTSAVERWTNAKRTDRYARVISWSNC